MYILVGKIGIFQYIYIYIFVWHNIAYISLTWAAERPLQYCYHTSRMVQKTLKYSSLSCYISYLTEPCMTIHFNLELNAYHPMCFVKLGQMHDSFKRSVVKNLFLEISEFGINLLINFKELMNILYTWKLIYMLHILQ